MPIDAEKHPNRGDPARIDRKYRRRISQVTDPNLVKVHPPPVSEIMKIGKVRLRVFSLSAVLALATVSSALGDGGLKYTGKVDSVRKFKVNAAFRFSDNDITLNSDVASKITKVDDAGLVTVQLVTTNLKVTAGGQDVPSPDTPTALYKVFRPDGTLAELRGEGASPEAYRLETLTSVKLPNTALKQDATWTWDVPGDTKTGVAKATIAYKVLGDEKIAGVDSWKISRTVKELAGDAPASDDGTVWVSKDDGIVVKQIDKWTNMPIHLSTSAVNGTLSVELQP